MTDGSLNAVDYAVISQGLLATAKEMGVKLIRSAYSTIIREAGDASASLFDSDGRCVAQAELIPMHLGTMSEILQTCIREDHRRDVCEDYFYITNDPYSGGQHLPDVFIFSPIYFEAKLVGFAGTVAHHLDLGGGSPGLTTEAVDIHAEGLIIPPSRYRYSTDWHDDTYPGPLQRLIAANIRVPQQTIGDFYAQFAANAIGAERVRQLCLKYGVRRLETTMTELLAYSERRFRAALSQIPNGVYFGDDAIDDDGIGNTPVAVRVKLTVIDESISIDFANTDKQVLRNLNCPLASTKSAALTAIKAALTSSDIPFNDGVKRAVEITAPSGSLVNPEYPAPVRARNEAAYRCFNAVLKALGGVAPKQIIAGGADTTYVTSLSKLNGEKYSVYLEVYGGGFGASAYGDGCDAVDSPLSNCTNTPVEATDMDFTHFRIIRYELIPDSCGHGMYRGGLGFLRSFLVLEDDVNFALYADRFTLSPYGLFGGTSGMRARCELSRNGSVTYLKSKDAAMLHKGDILTVYTAGGGGYGDAGDRPQRSVEEDLRQGFISPVAAEDNYSYFFRGIKTKSERGASIDD